MAKINLIPLTNQEVIDVCNSEKKEVRCEVIRPDGSTAFDEKMKLIGQPNTDKTMTVVIPLAGVKHFKVAPNGKRFEEKDRGYTFYIYNLKDK